MGQYLIVGYELLVNIMLAEQIKRRENVMRDEVRNSLIIASVALLGAVGASANQNDVTVPRDKNSSATVFDSREGKARDVLKDVRILGTNYTQVQQINIILDVGRTLAGWNPGDVTYIHVDPKAFPQSVTLTNVLAWHGKPDRVIAFTEADKAGPAKDAGAWGSVFLAFDGESKLVGLGIPVAWAISGARMSGVDGGPAKDLLTFLREGKPSLPITPKAGQSGNMPPFSEGILDLAGGNLTIENPSDKTLSVGIRSGYRGRDLVVKPGEKLRQSLANGKYDIYFITDAAPEELLQGDSIFIDSTDVTIKYTKVPEGNYQIRKIK